MSHVERAKCNLRPGAVGTGLLVLGGDHGFDLGLGWARPLTPPLPTHSCVAGGYGPPPAGRGAPPPPPPFTSYIVSTPPGGFPPPQGFPQGYGAPPQFSECYPFLTDPCINSAMGLGVHGSFQIVRLCSM